MAWVNPRTWVSGETVTAALMNTIRDALKAIGDPWTAYTPTISGWTLSNGSLAGSAYKARGKHITGRIVYTVGSTDTKSGVIAFTPPVNAKADTEELAVGTATVYDASGSVRYARTAFLASTSSLQLVDEASTRVTHLAPFTFATGDIMMISFDYEAA